ncbi:uncharacterized protein MELLADRAFT_66352 [Melampsora larici-populina 98AG31]|uniref:FACT complex subunit n=1 Tax=Melampsora larici-populina (strain 98AG31 / pathotype 3-4-7) TaxID=747676 RepID=F4RYV1_MELLP|nr:uncharacterized protein MELLADRAFT_66352 [Melampsora larici-populina 98AG31]EGG02440.1 hypothetical protein MELLADRAFT_66352 [Melampsora larici-populina 98AG31]
MTRKLMAILFEQVQNLIKTGNKTTHKQLSAVIQAELRNSDIWKGGIFLPSFDSVHSRWRYRPTIQSGGAYNLRTWAQSTAERLDDTGIILARLGIRYKFYCSDISRSIMIDPHPLQKFALQELKEGVIAKNFYQTIVSKVSRERPDLGSSLPESFGFGIGIESTDPFLRLDTSCHRVLKCDMIFSLEMSFSSIQDPFDSSKTYSLQLIDTVAVKQDSSITLSGGLKALTDITIFSKNKQRDGGTSEASGSGDIDQNELRGPAERHASRQESSIAAIPTSKTGQLQNDEQVIYKNDTVPQNLFPKEVPVSKQQEEIGSSNCAQVADGIETEISAKVKSFAIPPRTLVSSYTPQSKLIGSDASASLQTPPTKTPDLKSSTSLTVVSSIVKDISVKQVEKLAVPPKAPAIQSQNIGSNVSTSLQTSSAKTLDLESSTSLAVQPQTLGLTASKHASDHGFSQAFGKDICVKEVENSAVLPTTLAIQSQNIGSDVSTLLQTSSAKTLDLESAISLAVQPQPLGLTASKHASDHGFSQAIQKDICVKRVENSAVLPTTSTIQSQNLRLDAFASLQILPTETPGLESSTILAVEPRPLGLTASSLKRARYSDHALRPLGEVKKLKAIAISDAKDQTIMAKKLDGLDEDTKKWYVLKKKQILKKLQQDIMEEMSNQTGLNTS